MLDVTKIAELIEKERQREMQAANNAAYEVSIEDAANVQTRNGSASDPLEEGDEFIIPVDAIANKQVLWRFTRAEDALKSPEEKKKAPKMYFLKIMVTDKDGNQQVKTVYPSQFTKRLLAYIVQDDVVANDGWKTASGTPATDYASELNLGASLKKIEGKKIRVVKKTTYKTRPFGVKGTLRPSELVDSSILDFEYINL